MRPRNHLYKVSFCFLLSLLVVYPLGATAPMGETHEDKNPPSVTPFCGPNIDECEKDEHPPSPQLECTVSVANYKDGIFAQVTGSESCTEALKLPSGAENFVVRFSIAEKDRDKIRFSGSKPTCGEPVSEAPGCDFSPSPFLGFECHENDLRQGSLGCPECIKTDDAFCYANVTAESVDLKINNVNDCNDPPLEAFFTYMIAVKATEPITVEDQEYCRIYLVDPTVIQEPNCPEGC